MLRVNLELVLEVLSVSIIIFRPLILSWIVFNPAIGVYTGLLSSDEVLGYSNYLLANLVMLIFASGIWFGFEFCIINCQAPNLELVYYHPCNCYVYDLFSLDNILTRNPKFKILKDAIFNPSQQPALLIVSAFYSQECATFLLLCLCCNLCRITVSRFGSLLKKCQPRGGIYILLYFLVIAGQF